MLDIFAIAKTVPNPIYLFHYHTDSFSILKINDLNEQIQQ